MSVPKLTLAQSSDQMSRREFRMWIRIMESICLIALASLIISFLYPAFFFVLTIAICLIVFIGWPVRRTLNDLTSKLVLYHYNDPAKHDVAFWESLCYYATGNMPAST